MKVGETIKSFEAEAYYPDGKIKNLKLSDYKGKWVVIFLRLPNGDQRIQQIL